MSQQKTIEQKSAPLSAVRLEIQKEHAHAPTTVPVALRPATSLSQIPGLDGLRALAILSVIAFHLNSIGPLALGWAGVPLFFVISGFLITRILLSTRDQPRYFRNFYVRRTLRIFPIYYLYIAAMSVLALLKNRSLSDLPYYMTYSQTWPIILNRAVGMPTATAHTWSLAIEEQFYCLWPLIVWLTRRRSLVKVLFGVMLLAPLLRLVLALTSTNSTLLFAALPVQIDTLAAGALLAFVTHTGAAQAEHLRRWGLWAALGGATIVGALVLHFGCSAFAHPQTWTLKPANALLITGMSIGFGGLTAATVGGASYLRWLAWPVLRYVGTRSYGLYMYHLAVFEGVARMLGPLGVGRDIGMLLIRSVVSVGATMIVAEMSWRYIEKPLLMLKERFAPTHQSN